MQRWSVLTISLRRATLNQFPGSLLQGFSLQEGNMHKQLAMIVLLALGFTMSGCGSVYGRPGSGNINGTWAVALTNTDGSPAYTFSTTFTQGSGSTLNITNFTFTSTGPCFAGYQTSETGSFGLMGNFNGNVTGTFDMAITTMFPGAT